MALSPTDISGWVNNYLGAHPNDYSGVYNAARQYGVYGPQLESAMGWNPGTVNQWTQQNGMTALTDPNLQAYGNPYATSQNPYAPNLTNQFQFGPDVSQAGINGSIARMNNLHPTANLVDHGIFTPDQLSAYRLNNLPSNYRATPTLQMPSMFTPQQVTGQQGSSTTPTSQMPSNQTTASGTGNSGAPMNYGANLGGTPQYQRMDAGRNVGQVPGQNSFTGQGQNNLPIQSWVPPYQQGTTGTNGPYSGAPLTNAAYNGLNAPLWNPNIQNSMDTTVTNASNQFLQNVSPALTSQAIAAGGYGGDRANIAQGVAAANTASQIAPTIANMNLQGWDSGANRQLAAGQLGLQGLLGLGQLDIGRTNAQTNAASTLGQLSGQPMFGNPLSSGLGTGLTLAQLMQMLNTPG